MGGGHFHSEELVSAGDSDGDFSGAGLGWIGVGDSWDGGGSSAVLVELGEPVEGSDDSGGVDVAFESVAGFGLESELLAGASDAGVVEVGGFEEAAGGGGGHFGFRTTHDTGDGDGFFRVADHHLSGLEVVPCAIDGGEGFAGGGFSDDDPLSLKEVEVEGVERLSDFEHDVVSEVDEEGDGAGADLAESFLEPFGAFAVGGVFEDPAGVSGAVGGLDFDAGFGPDVSGSGVVGGEVVLGFLVEVCRFGVGVFGEEFAGEAKDAGSVASVGHDIDVEDGFAFDDFDVFELKPGHGEEVADLLGCAVGFDVVFEHGEGEFHGFSCGGQAWVTDWWRWGRRGLGELVEEPEVVFEEHAEVVGSGGHHGDAFDAESEREAGIGVGVDAVGFEDVGMDEAGAAEFDPFSTK